MKQGQHAVRHAVVSNERLAIDGLRPRGPAKRAAMTAPPKILAIASGGGHWVQLRRLAPAFEGAEVAFASVHADYRDDVPGHRYHAFDDVSRFNKHKVVKVAFQIARILRRERPDVVLTTGAGPGLIALALAKPLTGARTIWIDSIANSERLSSSGAWAGRFADVWLTQWPHLAGSKGPAHWGTVL